MLGGEDGVLGLNQCMRAMVRCGVVVGEAEGIWRWAWCIS